jgi:signal transduction histidine kinase
MSTPYAAWAGPALLDTSLLWALLPLVLNITSLIFAGFIAITWIRRRSEATVGMVALLWGAASLRNVWRLFSGTPPLGSWADWADWADFSVHIVLPCLAIHLCLSMLGPVSKTRLKLLYGGALVFLIIGISLPQGEALFWLRIVGYGTLLATACLTFLHAAARTRQLADVTHFVILRGLSIVWLASLLDYLRLLAGWADRMPSVLLYAVPLALLLSAWALLQRLVRTTAAAQLANAELERRVQQRTKELEAANAAKSRFLAAASHDLRQPMVTIGLLIDLLRDLSSDERQRAMIDRVDSAVASMEVLLGGLLDLSRFEAGTVSPRREPVDLQALFKAVASHGNEAARMKGLQLRFRGARLGVRSDPLLLEQILRNLVSNALRYTEKGGVLVTARQRGQRVWIQVWDTGIGIPEDQQGAIFEEFVQLHNPARDRVRGMGLGLAIVQRAASLMGHRLFLRSVPGRGSCFGVELPQATLPRAVPAARQLPERPLNGLRLALLEDDTSVRAALKERLQQWGAQVDGYDSLMALREACQPSLDAHEALPWHLLITDQRLPDGSGIEALAWLRGHAPRLPAVVITGNTQPDELAALDHCQAPVLHKPFRAETLLETVMDECLPQRA